MGFDCKFVKFTYSIKCLAINEASAVLKMAVINNKAACNKLLRRGVNIREMKIFPWLNQVLEYF